MPNFEITTHERWDHAVHYSVEALTAEVAVRMVASGKVPCTGAEYRESNPIQEVLSIRAVTNNDTNETIKGEETLKRPLDDSIR